MTPFFDSSIILEAEGERAWSHVNFIDFLRDSSSDLQSIIANVII